MSHLRQRLRALERRPTVSRQKLPCTVADALIAGQPVDLRPWQPVVDAILRSAEAAEAAELGEGIPALEAEERPLLPPRVAEV